MRRLTEEVKYPLTTFNRCQLCGRENDICAFDMWIECDENDKPEKDNILIICQEGDCRKRLDKHPRGYIPVPWSAGGPGKFMLLCGDCPHRSGGKCNHRNLVANGGDGLLVTFTETVLSKSIICGSFGCITTPQPATGCEGLPEDHRNHISRDEIAKPIIDS